MNTKNNRYVDALNEAMTEIMKNNDNALIIGQGVTDFKGLFGTTSGLKDKYKNRVIETPLAEDSVAGICIGASLNGMYPINTHIRADFSLLIFNQLINLAAKYKYMFGGLFEVPMMVRLIIGRSWGQGAQHSQSLQSLFAHIPGLVVLMPSNSKSIIESYKFAASQYKGPVVMLEHRLMYELEFKESNFNLENPMFGSYIEVEGTDVTVIATSIMVLESKRAASFLREYGISVEVIDLHSVSHPDKDIILKSISKTGKLIIADTSWGAYGVAAEVNRIINNFDPSILKKPVLEMVMANSPCPTAQVLEDMFYPDIIDLMQNIIKLTNSEHKNITLPKKESMTKFYKHFKGPF